MSISFFHPSSDSLSYASASSLYASQNRFLALESSISYGSLVDHLLSEVNIPSLFHPNIRCSEILRTTRNVVKIYPCNGPHLVKCALAAPFTAAGGALGVD